MISVSRIVNDQIKMIEAIIAHFKRSDNLGAFPISTKELAPAREFSVAHRIPRVVRAFSEAQIHIRIMLADSRDIGAVPKYHFTHSEDKRQDVC